MPACVREGVQSDTTEVTAYHSPLGDIHIDTPGLGDTRAPDNTSTFDDQAHLRRLLLYMQRSGIERINRVYLHCNPTNRESAVMRMLVQFVREFIQPASQSDRGYDINAFLNHVILLVTSMESAKPYVKEFSRFGHVLVTRNLILGTPERRKFFERIEDDDEQYIVIDVNTTSMAYASNARKLKQLAVPSGQIQASRLQRQCGAYSRY